MHAADDGVNDLSKADQAELNKRTAQLNPILGVDQTGSQETKGLRQLMIAATDDGDDEQDLGRTASMKPLWEHAVTQAAVDHWSAAGGQFQSCLDRPFVQKEIAWAVQYSKKIIVVVEKDERRVGFFDFAVAWEKYRGTDLEHVLNIDAIPYQRDEDYAAVMVQKIIKKAGTDSAAGAAASNPPLNDPGSWDYFLSHAQATGGDQAQTTSLRLHAAGKTTWYDNAMQDRSTAAMEEGVQGCGSFLLFLTGERTGSGGASVNDRSSGGALGKLPRKFTSILQLLVNARYFLIDCLQRAGRRPCGAERCTTGTSSQVKRLPPNPNRYIGCLPMIIQSRGSRLQISGARRRSEARWTQRCLYECVRGRSSRSMSRCLTSLTMRTTTVLTTLSVVRMIGCRC